MTVTSKGHIGWFTRPDGTKYELYEQGGELYTAPYYAVMDIDTGNRIGRWEAPMRMLASVKEVLKTRTAFGL